MKGVLWKADVNVVFMRTYAYGRDNPLLHERWRLKTRTVNSRLPIITDVSIPFFRSLF